MRMAEADVLRAMDLGTKILECLHAMQKRLDELTRIIDNLRRESSAR
jgi:hypothetical protein